MRRVLEGGVGCCSGGIEDRSRLRDFLEDLLEARDGACGRLSGNDDGEDVEESMVEQEEPPRGNRCGGGRRKRQECWQ